MVLDWNKFKHGSDQLSGMWSCNEVRLHLLFQCLKALLLIKEFLPHTGQISLQLIYLNKRQQERESEQVNEWDTCILTRFLTFGFKRNLASSRHHIRNPWSMECRKDNTQFVSYITRELSQKIIKSSMLGGRGSYPAFCCNNLRFEDFRVIFTAWWWSGIYCRKDKSSKALSYL